MDQYIDIRLLPDPELAPPILMNTLFGKLHHALVEGRHDDIGVSFPRATRDLGDILRLHGRQEALERLMGTRWTQSLKDYTEVTPIRSVPQRCGYRLVQRIQSKSSPSRLYRRSVRKGWLTAEEAQEKSAQTRERHLKRPYVQLRSASSSQTFRLFIDQNEERDSPQQGAFSAYGLSHDATVPWF